MTGFQNRFLLCVVYCSIVSQVYCITVDEFYRFGESAGDSSLARELDGSSQPIILRTEFPFYDEIRRTVHVSSYLLDLFVLHNAAK